ncbi:PAS domain S-box protein [Desulfarculus baarsii]
MTPPAKASLLIVEDEFIVAQHLRASLESMGYEVAGLADSAAEAVELAERLRPDLVLMDIFLAGPSDGIEAAMTIRRRLGRPVVFLTAQLDDDIIQRAAAAQPHGYLNKPFKIKEVQAVVETALHKAAMEAELAAGQERLRLILDATSDGAWDCDLRADRVFLSEKGLALLGRDGQDPHDLAAWLGLVHPDDLPSLEAVAQALRQDAPTLDVQLRLLGADGQWRFLHCRGRAVAWRADGAAGRVVGTLTDITAQKADQAELAEARERFMHLARFTSDALLLIHDGKIVHFNPAHGQSLGYGAADLEGVEFTRLLAPHDRRRVGGYHRRRLAGESAPEEFVADIVDVDGQIKPMSLRSQLARHHGRQLVLTAMRPLKGHDAEAADSHGLTGAVLDNLPVGLAVFALDSGLCIYMNDNYGRVVGWPKAELPSVGKILGRLFPDREERRRRLADVRPGPASDGRQKRQWNNIAVQTRDHGRRYISTMSIAVPDHGVIISTVWDVDSQRRAERALAASEEKYRQLVENAGEAIVIVQDGAVRLANPSAARFFGLPPAELAGQNIAGLIHPDDRAKALALYAQHQSAAAPPAAGPHRMLRRDLGPGWVESRVAPVEWEGRPAVLACLTDVTEAVQAQESLKERNETLQAMINASPLAVIGLNHRGEVVLWSGAAQAMFGWDAEEVLGRFNPLAAPQERAEFERHLARARDGRQALHLEMTCKAKDGRPVDMTVHVAPVRGSDGRAGSLLCLVEDVSERRRQERVWARLEEHLSQNRRLEAVGVLASGVAHEFNNILAAIIGYGELAKEDLQESRIDSPLHFLDNQMKAAERGRELVRQILAFSRHGSGRRRRVDLAPVLAQQVRLLRAVVPANVALRAELCEGPLSAEADPAQIQQVLLNLTTNAVEAFDGGDGSIIFQTDVAAFDEADAAAPPGLAPGRYLRLRVDDDGPGMPQGVLERACEPFYTTKKQNRNAGLGLAEAHGVISAHGGRLILHSRLERGSRVEAFIPLCDKPLPAATEPGPAPDQGCARILFVDDERSLVEIAQRLLTNMGHRVEAFGDARLALQAFVDDPQAYDLLISDQSMPHLSGLELAARVTALRPGLPVIICTGHGQQLTPQSLARAGVGQLLYKPVDKRELAAAIGRAMAGRAAPLSTTGPRPS